MRALALALALIVLWAQSAPAWAQDQLLADLAANLFRQWEEVAFGCDPELRDLAACPSPDQEVVTKWDGPVRIKVIGNLPMQPDAVWEVMALAKLLSSWTYREVRVVEDENVANMLVIIAPRAELFEYAEGDPNTVALLSRALCAGVMYQRPRGTIVAHVAYIDSTLPIETARDCLEEEIVQGFGLPHDSDLVSPSLFREGSNDETSILDALVVRGHYDPRLKPGMPRNEARMIAAQIFSEVRW